MLSECIADLIGPQIRLFEMQRSPEICETWSWTLQKNYFAKIPFIFRTKQACNSWLMAYIFH